MTTKIAISSSRVLGALQARAAQGARVAPQLMQQAASQAGSATTSPMLRRMALSAGDDARAALRVQQRAAHPITAARRGVAEQVTHLESQPGGGGMLDLKRSIAGTNMEDAWASQQKKDMLFGGGSQLHDPNAVLTVPRTPAPSPRVQIPAAGSNEPTAVGRTPRTPTPAPAPAPAASSAEPTQVAPTMLAPPGSIPGMHTPTPTTLTDATVVKRPPPKIAALATMPHAELLTDGTHTSGRREMRDTNPASQVSTAFNETQRQVDTSNADQAKYAARRLHGRLSFRGLPVSIENRKGSYREWYDPHAKKHGRTQMRYPYGYIRGTKGLDGDHVDVFVGPNEHADNVYVILTRKAPFFTEIDEHKCMLGFDSAEDAKKAFHQHYDNPKFFDSMTTMPFSEFEEKVFGTKPKKVAYDTGAVQRQWSGPKPPGQGQGVMDVRWNDGTQEQGLGYPDIGNVRHVIGEPLDTMDRIGRQFDFADQDQRTTAIEDGSGGPSGGPLL